MPSVLERLPHGAHVAVIRLRSLGDCVLTTPALSLLHEYRPDLEITVIVEDRFAALFAGHPAVRRTVAPGFWAARGQSPDLCLNLHGGSRSMWMTAASGARFRAGFGHHQGRFIYNVPIPRAQEILGEERTVHTAEHLAAAMFHLGVPIREIPRASLAVAAPLAAGRAYAVLHPFASAPEKAWSAEKFAAVGAFIEQTLGLAVKIIGAPGDDITPFDAFECHVGQPLENTKSILAGASLFVGNDSGPAHMAAAFARPVVVLFGASDPVVWAPWRTRSEKFVSPDGIARIPVEQVTAAVQRVLSREELPA
ncbi:MAG: glycosyltransferase family 9 protein [Bryobacteraceae bacterium]|nr:glycosyltransferase family 9 protein [Bryobacteraceae bacterium]